METNTLWSNIISHFVNFEAQKLKLYGLTDGVLGCTNIIIVVIIKIIIIVIAKRFTGSWLLPEKKTWNQSIIWNIQYYNKGILRTHIKGFIEYQA